MQINVSVETRHALSLPTVSTETKQIKPNNIMPKFLYFTDRIDRNKTN